MDSTKQHLEQQQVRGAGLAGELRQLNKDGTASAAELRQFLSQLKGRSPEEVMGVVAQSGLIGSMLTATLVCLVLLVVGTIGPYALQDGSSDAKDQTAAAAGNASPASNAEAAADATETAAAGSLATSPEEPDLERAAEAMGIGGAAEADPNKNPLDTKLDNLLDGIE